jgi:hypothetical protein
MTPRSIILLREDPRKRKPINKQSKPLFDDPNETDGSKSGLSRRSAGPIIVEVEAVPSIVFHQLFRYVVWCFLHFEQVKFLLEIVQKVDCEHIEVRSDFESRHP